MVEVRPRVTLRLVKVVGKVAAGRRISQRKKQSKKLGSKLGRKLEEVSEKLPNCDRLMPPKLRTLKFELTGGDKWLKVVVEARVL